MKISEITVHAGRTFNHPYEQYANFKPGLSLRALLEDGDDPEGVAKALQAQAERLAEAQKQDILADLHQLEQSARRASSIASTEREIRRLQSQLADLQQEKVRISHNGEDEHP